MKPFRIFRPGSHVASCGTRVEFTEEDLKRAVAAYDPGVYAAPLVIGHPKTEDRAYGWAESLSYEDGHVVAHPDKVEPTFAELVAQGAYRNRSASWYMPDHPNNPSPGNLYPKHIGFLGAVPPALKGLGDVAFTEGSRPVEFLAEEHPDKVVEFADDATWGLASLIGSLARMMRGLRDMRIEEKGVEEADKLLPDYVITDAENTARELRDKAMKNDGSMMPSYTEPTPKGTNAMTPEQIAALQAENEANKVRVAEFSARETALTAAEHLATVDAIERTALQPLVKAGKLLPAESRPLAEFMAGLDNKAQTIEFGEPAEGQTEKPKVSARAFLTAFLGKLPKRVDYSERGAPNLDGSGAMTPLELGKKARALVDKHRTDTGTELSYREAVDQVLAVEGVTVEDPSTAPQV